MAETGTLEGKVVIVTGAARGLGQAYVVRLAQAGAKVIAADKADCSATVAAANEQGGETAAVQVDVTVTASAHAMAAAATERYGGIDVLVNNAALWGALSGGRFEALDEAEWDVRLT